MRALAELVMRGRAQAILVAVLCVIAPLSWVSAAVVGLVTLRKGAQEGSVVLACTVLAAAVAFLLSGDVGPIAILIGTAGAALVLRWTRSWPNALIVAVLVGLCTGLLLLTLASGYTEAVLKAIDGQFEQLRAQLPADQAKALQIPTVAHFSGGMGFRVTCVVMIALLLARWAQAKLYNPGGFRTEFHQLRLPLPLAVGLIAGSALAGPLGPGLEMLFVLPLLLAGLALVHGVVGLKGWGVGPLWALYLVWLPLFFLVTPGLMLTALIDSGLNFRARLRKDGA
jgi:hypothetical protein